MQSMLWLVLSLAVGVVLAYLTTLRIPPLSDSSLLVIKPSNLLACESPVSDPEEALVIYAESFREGQRLVDALCARDSIRQIYGNIVYRWAFTDDQILSAAKSGVFDLAFGRPHTFESYSVNIIAGYKPIASYKDYGAYLITSGSYDSISSKVLDRLKIGMLDSEESRSGYIIPHSFINSLDRNQKNLNIHYYAGHWALREAFLNKEIDAFFSYWASEDAIRFPEAQAHSIHKGVAGAKWYMSNRLFDDQIRCIFQDFLSAFAVTSGTQYYQDLEVIEPCR
jgi:hypothetical protein